jgi:hypothetical protein
MVKQVEREAVCAYLAKIDGRLAKDFLSELVAIWNDDCDLYLDECLDGHFYVKVKQLGRISENSVVLYANMFAVPHLIAFMRLCSATEPMRPAECAVFVTARLFEIAKKHSKDKILLFRLEVQRNHTATMVDCKAHTDECHIAFIEGLLTGYIREYLL